MQALPWWPDHADLTISHLADAVRVLHVGQRRRPTSSATKPCPVHDEAAFVADGQLELRLVETSSRTRFVQGLRQTSASALHADCRPPRDDRCRARRAPTADHRGNRAARCQKPRDVVVDDAVERSEHSSSQAHAAPGASLHPHAGSGGNGKSRTIEPVPAVGAAAAGLGLCTVAVVAVVKGSQDAGPPAPPPRLDSGTSTSLHVSACSSPGRRHRLPAMAFSSRPPRGISRHAASVRTG